MLSTVAVSHLLATSAKVLFERRIHNNLLSYGVPGELPDKLVLPARPLVIVGGVDDMLVSGVDVTMVLLDGLGDGLHGCCGAREVAGLCNA
jgi:hypothetical protein